ncbi:hypothetical protein DN752_19480 [Echinicola strongylocentroti]|uniref:Uncharacterized protein n=1 Tax=Echinicola strongylocentroti TaxID=1795355 RepID=A0A2Z4IML7_9BACT|nr:hypothetical protein [Echinicola strongylocentroti]AWW32145.1 hypothetical protein DN752_19480 [Echinicola strongylocentroti]
MNRLSLRPKSQEILSLLDYIGLKDNVRVQLNKLSPDVIGEIAGYFKLKVYTPEDHPMDFYFCKGYFDPSGRVIPTKRNSTGSFSLSSVSNLPQEIFL